MQKSFIFILSTVISVCFSQEISISGKVLNSMSNPVSGVIVNMKKNRLKDTTGSDGVYNIQGIVPISYEKPSLYFNTRLEGVKLFFAVKQNANNVNIELYTLAGKKIASIMNDVLLKGNYSLNPLSYINTHLSLQLLILRVTVGNKTDNFKLLHTKQQKGGMLVKTEIILPEKTKGTLAEDILEYIKDGQIITTNDIEKLVDTLPDLLIAQRDIYGDLLSASETIGKIRAVITGDAIPDSVPKEPELWYNSAANSYSGVVYFVYSIGVKNYSVYVNVYNSENAFIGRSVPVSFSSQAGDVQIPTFNPENAKPIAYAMADTLVGINDTLKLHCTASDSFGGTISRWEWNINGDGYFETLNGDTTILAPSVAQALVCSLRVTDNDGLSGVDVAIITVTSSTPSADAGNDTIIGINDPINLYGSGTDSDGFIVKYEWKFGDSSWVITSNGNTTIEAPGVEKIMICSLRVTDDDGLVGVDDLTIRWRVSDGTIIDSVIDIDGNKYYGIRLGSQIWTTVNLRTTKYNDGTTIPEITENAAWSNDSLGAYCYYNNDSAANIEKNYGVLYNWYAVSTDKLAPVGWHVPTDAEWDTLQNYLIANGYNWDGTTTGNKIGKSLAAKTDWIYYVPEGVVGHDLLTNNSSGFSALPSGYREGSSNFVNQGHLGGWWSVREYSVSSAYKRRLSFSSEALLNSSPHKRIGSPVRLLRD